MNVAGFTPPFYVRHGKKGQEIRQRSLRAHLKRCGVYVIKENGEVVYIGMSASCVVEACYRHFYYWNDFWTNTGKHYRVTYYDKLGRHKYEVAILELTPEQSATMERGLIIALNPRDNKQKYDYYINQLVDKRVEETSTENQNSEDDNSGIPDDLPF